MLGLLGWLGGFFGADGDELVEQEARALRAAMGRGLYTEDPETLHGRLLRVFAVALAYARAYEEQLVRNANPALAVQTLDDWEEQCGLPRGNTMSVQDRQARLAAWMRWSRWGSKTAITGFCTEYLGPLFLLFERIGVNDYLITVDPAVYADPNLRLTMERYVDWVSPAHVKLVMTA